MCDPDLSIGSPEDRAHRDEIEVEPTTRELEKAWHVLQKIGGKGELACIEPCRSIPCWCAVQIAIVIAETRLSSERRGWLRGLTEDAKKELQEANARIVELDKECQASMTVIADLRTRLDTKLQTEHETRQA